MNEVPLSSSASPIRQRHHKLSRDTVFVVGDLLPLFDFLGVLLAALLATFLHLNWDPAAAADISISGNTARAALTAAVIAPFILCDRTLVALASSGQTALLLRCFMSRFAIFVAAVAMIGGVSRSLDALPQSLLTLWLLSSLLITAGIRVALVSYLRHLERTGVLNETIAIVGCGPVADRLVHQLIKTRGSSVEVLGIFDDRTTRSGEVENKPNGSITDLIELGKSTSIDWLLLTLPGSADQRLQSMVHRLKAIAVPIGLCPQNIGLAIDWRDVRRVGDGVAVTLLADHSAKPWDRTIAEAEIVLPRWMLTLTSLWLLLLSRLFSSSQKVAPAAVNTHLKTLHCPLDDYDLERFTEVARNFGQGRYGYVVTPNVDHLIRLHQSPTFRTLYADAAYVLLDSRFIAHLLKRTQNLKLRVCTGSDLTAKLFSDVVKTDDKLVLVGGSEQQAACLRKRYGLNNLAHFNPPMGFMDDPLAVEACLQFVEAHSPFRYCWLALGAPRQEEIAQRLQQRGRARGLTLCIGAAINFLTGHEQRAPLWVQGLGFEWLFRLLQAPRRMASRYLIRGPQIFWLLRRTNIRIRVADSPPLSRLKQPAYQPIAQRDVSHSWKTSP